MRRKEQSLFEKLMNAYQGREEEAMKDILSENPRLASAKDPWGTQALTTQAAFREPRGCHTYHRPIQP